MPRLCILVLIAFYIVTAAADRPGATAGEVERAYGPGENFRDCEKCPEMVVVPAGEFVMVHQTTNKDTASRRVRSTRFAFRGHSPSGNSR